MSEKKGIYLMFDEWPMLEQLPDVQLGKLIRSIVKYEATGEVMPLPALANVAFLSIQQRMERTEATRVKKSAAGKKGMESRYGKREEPASVITDSGNSVITDTSTTISNVITDHNNDRAKARELWQQGQQIKDISAELGVPAATVSSWKRRDDWEGGVDVEQQTI